MYICFSSSCQCSACALILGQYSEELLKAQCWRFSSKGFLVPAIPCVQNKIMGIEKLASVAACQHSRISGRDVLANLICILSHVSDTCEVALYWRAISIPLSSCLSMKFAHHNENELQNWKKRGCLAVWKFLCSCVAVLWWVSAPLHCSMPFRLFKGHGRAAAPHQALQEKPT